MNWMKHAPIFYEKITNILEVIVLIEGFHAYTCVYIYKYVYSGGIYYTYISHQLHPLTLGNN